MAYESSASIQSVPPDDLTIQEAATILRNGGLVAFPTETVYGLGADAANQRALQRLFEVKGRPKSHPVIVHLPCFDQITHWASQVPETAKLLANEFWPGPLTMILPRNKAVSDLITGGQESIALRIPNHPVALALLRFFGGGVAAPSANKFGRISPTRAQEVYAEFGLEIGLILDGGACQVGIESTIVDLTGSKPEILRPGMISAKSIGKVLSLKAFDSMHRTRSLIRVPGDCPRHYAPATPLQLVDLNSIKRMIHSKNTSENRKESVFGYAVLSFENEPKSETIRRWITLPKNPSDYARQLYRCLRELDSLGAKVILVEQIPNSTEWLPIKDRLMRAQNLPIG